MLINHKDVLPVYSQQLPVQSLPFLARFADRLKQTEPRQTSLLGLVPNLRVRTGRIAGS